MATTGTSSGSIEVPMDAILSQAVARVAEELLSDLRPRLEHTEQASCSARRRATAGSGLVAAVVVLAGYLAWGAYARDQEAQAARDARISEQYKGIAASLVNAEKAGSALAAQLVEQAGDIRTLKIEINRQTEAINAVWREELGKRAVPRPRPFPDVSSDVVSGASGR